ncbi:L-aspartate oxidase [Prochlorococcus sp. MIT 1307]|uniref:L-aspartate oxidase n=1 Tax=Prochlorococcus sp. MIT 1307 TaxID=3096219 RepID=UPI002A761D4E|nr:L-aspartate oxidase [Prochlorococcus sp. MIT 1307]
MQTSSIPGGPWDVVVIGAGAAGLMSCLELPAHLKVLLLNRNTSRHSSSRWAQGGMAAVTRAEDSFQSHAEDTMKAGAGLCDGDAVRMFVEEAPQCIQRLEKIGMDFDRDCDQLATTLEAAHSFRRVLHVQDRTGRALVEVLEEQVDQRPNLVHRRGVRVTQLWVESNACLGVQILDGPFLRWISARAVVLASGGGGHLFSNTTNPAQACGEGLALAWRAGALIEDLEFVQFHPTALHLDNGPCFLISEALRGEGAVLVDKWGQSPVAHLDGADLAPRDQVSRALVQAMERQMVNHMELDIKSIPPSQVEAHFPSILQRCKELGLDPLKNLIPVAPAAHYWMGGVATNLRAETTLKGLFAVGEIASSGLHGANRLASNSLMECLVFARKMSTIELTDNALTSRNLQETSSIDCSLRLSGIETAESLSKSIQDLRQLCWQEVGVNRSLKGMQKGLNSIRKAADQLVKQPLLQLMHKQAKNLSIRFDETSRRDINLLLDLSNRQLTSSLLFEACIFRCESRGGHFRTDSPKSLPYWKCHSQQKCGQAISTRPVKD